MNDVTNWERIVLGTILDQPKRYVECMALRKEDFQKSHQPIWIAIESLYNVGSLTSTTVLETMRENRSIEGIGTNDVKGDEYLLYLVSQADPDSLKLAVERVMEKGVKEELSIVAKTLAVESMNGTPSDEIINRTLELLLSAKRVDTRKMATISQLMDTYHARIERLRSGDNVYKWWPRLEPLKRIIPFVNNSEFIIVSAQSGAGKSSYLRYEALATAMEGHRVLTFNGESDEDWYTSFAIANISKIDTEKLRQPKSLTDAEWKAYMEAKETIHQLPWTIVDMTGMTVRDMLFIAKQEIIRHPVSLIQVDQIQNIAINDFAAMEDVTYALRSMAKELQVPVMAAHQIGRKIMMRQDKRPEKEDMLFAGERAAKQVWTIWMKEIDETMAGKFRSNKNAHGILMPRESWKINVISIIVAKNSSGPTGVTNDIAWNKGTNSYMEMTENWRRK